MGMLRCFLALTVLDWHYRFSDSAIFPFSFSAVICFYIISGFYMSLVINEKYKTSVQGLAKFYANRALRLYPINIAILAAFAFIAYWGVLPQREPFIFGSQMPAVERVLSILNQVLIVPDVLWQNVRLHPGANSLLFGQLYTVGLEIIFYALAPFIVTQRLRLVLLFTAVATALHFCLHVVGLPSRPWQYEFFPGILIFFLLGSLAYRGLLVLRTFHYPKWRGYLMLPVFLAYCFWVHSASTAQFTNNTKVFGLYILTTLMIPFLFEASKSARWDQAIGDLSYPLYAVHYLIGFAIVGLPGTGSAEENMKVLWLTLTASVALVLMIEKPIDRLRAAIAKSKQLNSVTES